MPTNINESWHKLLLQEYRFRFTNPFKKSGLFVFSSLILLSIGFLGSWLSVYESISDSQVVQDVNNKAFCGSVISLVIVSCVDVFLTLVNRDQKKHQKKVPIKDVTYVMSIGLISLFCITLALFGIAFSDTIYGTTYTIICVITSLLLWIQVNASNPIYFDSEDDMQPSSALPDLTASSKPNPYNS